jgi:hypothetical protein
MTETWNRWFWVMSGLASAAFAFVQEIMDTVSQGKAFKISFWAFAYVCLIIANRSTRRSLDAARKELEMKGFTEAKKREAKAQLDSLTEVERNGLKVLLNRQTMDGPQVREVLPDVDFTNVRKRTSFVFVGNEPLDITEMGQIDVWRIRDEWKGVLANLLDPEPKKESFTEKVYFAVVSFGKWIEGKLEKIREARRSRPRRRG